MRVSLEYGGTIREVGERLRQGKAVAFRFEADGTRFDMCITPGALVEHAERLEQMNHDKLKRLVKRIQHILWLDESGQWDEDKEWNADTLQDIAAIFEWEGLVPQEG